MNGAARKNHHQRTQYCEEREEVEDGEGGELHGVGVLRNCPWYKLGGSALGFDEVLLLLFFLRPGFAKVAVIHVFCQKIFPPDYLVALGENGDELVVTQIDRLLRAGFLAQAAENAA